MKLACEKCRKKFNDPMALEYHKITFHATAAPASNSSANNRDRLANRHFQKL